MIRDQDKLANTPEADPFTSPTPLKGIARLAAESDLTGQRKDVEFFSLPAKSILNRCTNPEMPFEWTINPYRGCEFGCTYCYARYTHEFMELRDARDFEKKIYAKENAAGILRRELRSFQKPNRGIAIGTATDPYQPAERHFQVTRQILEILAMARGLRLSITTKSDLVVRDLDLFREISRNNRLQINLSITTTDEKLARLLEPRAPRPDLRFEAVRKLVTEGLSAGVLMMPLLPAITTSDQNLEKVVCQAAQHQAQYLHAGVVFLMPSAQARFFPFLAKNFPHLVARYRKTFARSAFLPKEFKWEVLEKIRILKERFGIKERCGDVEETPYDYAGVAQQLEFGF